MCRFNDTAVLNCAPILKLFGMSLLNRSFAVNRTDNCSFLSVSRVTHPLLRGARIFI